VDVIEYTTIFPDKNTLETFTKISEILMSKHGLKVKNFKANVDPDASEILQSAWVKIYGLPSIALVEEVIMKVATLAGEPVVVDELSLIRVGPVRVKMNCVEPLKLRGFVRVFFNKVGYPIRFVAEKYKDKTTLPLPPPNKDDEEGDDMEEEDSSDEEEGDRKHKKELEVLRTRTARHQDLAQEKSIQVKYKVEMEWTSRRR
jgi:hypothetical protein